MSSPRGRAGRPAPPSPVALLAPRRRWPTVWAAVIVVTVIAVIAMEHTSHGRSIVSSIQEFLLKYAGVFALIGMTTAVGVGLLATDRIVMRPGHRVVAQSVHRGVSLGALAALVVHVALEIIAHKVGVLDVIIPFLARFRTLYTGLGTLAADLFVLIVATGFLRGRFAGKWPWAWRTIHAAAYAAWPLSVVHGLLGGRSAKPYVDWSYGGCLALVAIALAIRVVATVRTGDEKLAYPVSDRLSVPAEGLIPGSRVAIGPMGTGAVGTAGRRELPGARSGPISGPHAQPGISPPLPAAPDRQAPPQYANLLNAGPQYAEPDYADPRYRQSPPAYPEPPRGRAPGSPPRHEPPRYPQAQYSPAEYSQARYSQARELLRQQRQAQQRQERLMRHETPAPGWAPDGSGQGQTTERSSDSDMTDPHGWAPAQDPGAAYARPDPRDLTDAHGWPDPYGHPGEDGPR
jgi:hypothetical protein